MVSYGGIFFFLLLLVLLSAKDHPMPAQNIIQRPRWELDRLLRHSSYSRSGPPTKSEGLFWTDENKATVFRSRLQKVSNWPSHATLIKNNTRNT